MMSEMVVAMQDALAVIRGNGRWHLDERFTGHKPVCVAAVGPMHAHLYNMYESFFIRRQGRGPWQRITDGLPSPEGMGISVLRAGVGRPGTFYSANNLGVFDSVDGGRRWRTLEVVWPERFRRQHARGIAVMA
jgi:hypothetical protein